MYAVSVLKMYSCYTDDHKIETDLHFLAHFHTEFCKVVTVFQNIRTFRKTVRLICEGRKKKVLYCIVLFLKLDYLRFSFKG